MINEPEEIMMDLSGRDESSRGEEEPSPQNPAEERQLPAPAIAPDMAVPETAGLSETSVAAAAAQAKAYVQTRFQMAAMIPRDIDSVRDEILAHCKRPKFAEAARYRRPVGGGKVAEGASIRFVEAALQAMGNIDSQVFAIYEDDEKVIVRISVCEMQRNTSHSSDVTVMKTVERRKLREGQEPLGERVTSQGNKVYIVRATEDDMRTKINAARSREIRTNGLRIIPGDIVEEAMEACIKTQSDQDAKDPTAAKKAILDGFSQLGIPPSEIKKYLGHEGRVVTPAELSELRNVYQTIRDGHTTWVAVMDNREEERENPTPAAREKAAIDGADIERIMEVADKRAKAIEKKIGEPLSGQELLDDYLSANALELSAIVKSDLPKVVKEVSKFDPSKQEG